jgi:hypothetical protein
MKPLHRRLSSLVPALLLALVGPAPSAGIAADPQPLRPSKPASVTSATSAASPASAASALLSCKPVEGLAPLLVPGSVLLLGELHGTAESPAFTANAACLALAAGRPVTVALEIWQEEEARIATFLASEGAAADRAALFASPFWRDSYQDGRRSEAMAALLDDLRRFHHAGWPVQVTLLDRQVNGSSQDRDRAMAERLRGFVAAAPKDLVITLTGNLHPRLAKGVPWDKSYENMGFLFLQAVPGVKATSLNVRSTGGTAWYCQGLNGGESSCKVWPVKGTPGTGAQKVVVHPSLDGDGFNGIYEIGRATASPPAVPPVPPVPLPAPA